MRSIEVPEDGSLDEQPIGFAFDAILDEAAARQPGAPLTAAPERSLAHAPADATGPADAAMPDVAAAPLASAVKKRQLAMIGAGLAVAGLLIVTMLSMRSAASPDAAPARPEPAKRATATAATTTPAARTPAAAPVRPVAAPQWNQVTDGRWIGRDRKSVAVELPALNRIQIWTRDVTPLLVVRCSAGRIEAFVFTQSAAKMEPQDDDHTVRFAFDEGKDVTERWPDSSDHDALFAPDGAAFAEQLLRARTFRFGFTPHNAAPATARFDVTGLGELLAPSARQCGWKR